MAGARELVVLAFAVMFCIAEGPGLAVATLQDGRPRPDGFPDTPTMAYGPTPPCYLNGVVVTCEWYGFSHIGYETSGAACLATTRAVLANTTRVRPGDLEPFLYYYLKSMIFNFTNNDTYCLYGCFDMSASGPVASPPQGMAPPPALFATPPPVVVAPPPPSTLVTPPPPSVLATPPPDSLAPATTPTPPAAVSPPPPPPPPSNTRVVSLNGAGLLQPKGLASFIVSAALLILHGLVGF